MSNPPDVSRFVMNFKGKEYLTVAGRLLLFRAAHPDWTIKTQLVAFRLQPEVNLPPFALFRAEILSEDGRLIASAHKFEDVKGFPEFLEKGETGSIGRALAMAGFGAESSDEFEETGKVVDGPTSETPEVVASRNALKQSVRLFKMLATQRGHDLPDGASVKALIRSLLHLKEGEGGGDPTLSDVEAAILILAQPDAGNAKAGDKTSAEGQDAAPRSEPEPAPVSEPLPLIASPDVGAVATRHDEEYEDGFDDPFADEEEAAVSPAPPPQPPAPAPATPAPPSHYAAESQVQRKTGGSSRRKSSSQGDLL